MVEREKLLHVAGGGCFQEIGVKLLEHRAKTVMLDIILRMRVARKSANANLLESTESAPAVE